MAIVGRPSPDSALAESIDRSMRFYLKGRVRTSVGWYVAVTAWQPRERWLPLCHVVWPKWLLRDLVLADLEWSIMGVLRKMTDKDRAKLPAPQLHDEEFARQFPGLLEHLASPFYPDGQPRETSTLLMFVSDGMWKAVLRDRDNALCLWASAGSLDDLLEAMEAMVNDPGAIWRQDRASGAQAASRVPPVKRPGHKRK